MRHLRSIWAVTWVVAFLAACVPAVGGEDAADTGPSAEPTTVFDMADDAVTAAVRTALLLDDAITYRA